MNVIRFDDVNIFYARVEPYLLPREAEHNLTFGLLNTIRNDPARVPDAIFALVEDAEEIQFVALRTNVERALVVSLAQSPDAIPALAESLHASGIVLAAANGPADEGRAFVEAWSRLSGQSYRVETPMRSFRLTKVNPVTGVPGHLRRATSDDHPLLVRWEMGFRREAFPDMQHDSADVERSIDYRMQSGVGGIFVWDDGGAVSYAGYGGPTPHGIRIGPVYTPPEYRQRGYASACVAGMSQLLLDSGREFCFLFTDLRNPTSNHIYQVIGYQPICDFTEYVFDAD
ncbi:MAG: GNAT family N-acetyltransferase [Anaerolineae bacterium]|nr:GNAT family N-acetyltransferase [Anaerolineae bacterium]